MEERNVLSPEEVEAILQAAQKSGEVANEEAAAAPVADENGSLINTHSLNVIFDTFCTELENKFTVLLRKKVTVKSNPFAVAKVSECLKQASERDVYSAFKMHPSECYSIISVEYPFLDQSINLLYGGKMQEKIGEENWCGKIGIITGEKISRVILGCLADASKEYGKVEYEHYKTNRIISNVNNMQEEDEVYFATFSLVFEEFEAKFTIHVNKLLFETLIPNSVGKNQHQDKDFWRSAIKAEMMDSYVTVSMNLNDVNVKVKEFMELKEGDVIPISNPTLVYVCLNHLKLYRAVAGQSNGNMVVKVVSQI